MKKLLQRTFRLLGLVAVAAVLFIAAVLWWGSRDTTAYAPGFTEEAFEQLQPGMGLKDVYLLLGQPLGVREENSLELWCYGESSVVNKRGSYVVEDVFRAPRCVSFDESGVALSATGDEMAAVEEGMTAEDVLKLLGEPDRRRPAAAMTLHYSEPDGNGLFKARIVAVDATNRVSDVISYQFYD